MKIQTGISSLLRKLFTGSAAAGIAILAQPVMAAQTTEAVPVQTVGVNGVEAQSEAKSNLLGYLNHLDQNVSAREAHTQNPKQAMIDFGLSQQEQDAIHSGDKGRVAKLIGIDDKSLPTIVVSQF